MHPNPAFRGQDRADSLDFARERGFGVLTAAGPDGPLASHVPFVLSEDGARVGFHLVRSNPLAPVLKEGAPALLAVGGPDAYISPDWYDIGHDQVPTWNYVAVHLRGTARMLPPEALRDHLRAASAEFESRLAPKKPWTIDKMEPEQLARMERMILPAELEIAEIDGTWKLNQNKPAEARLRAAQALAHSPVVSPDGGLLAALMRDVGDKT